MKSKTNVMALLRVAVAAAAVMVMSPLPAYASNACSGCMTLSDLECGVQAAFIIDGCCGNWVDGFTQCVGGYGFAVACENGRQCMCNSQGHDCDIVRVAG